jgi:hypothetical protein
MQLSLRRRKRASEARWNAERIRFVATWSHAHVSGLSWTALVSWRGRALCQGHFETSTPRYAFDDPKPTPQPAKRKLYTATMRRAARAGSAASGCCSYESLPRKGRQNPAGTCAAGPACRVALAGLCFNYHAYCRASRVACCPPGDSIRPNCASVRHLPNVRLSYASFRSKLCRFLSQGDGDHVTYLFPVLRWGEAMGGCNSQRRNGGTKA